MTEPLSDNDKARLEGYKRLIEKTAYELTGDRMMQENYRAYLQQLIDSDDNRLKQYIESKGFQPVTDLDDDKLWMRCQVGNVRVRFDESSVVGSPVYQIVVALLRGDGGTIGFAHQPFYDRPLALGIFGQLIEHLLQTAP